MLESIGKHLRDRTVLVTGHTGFKGSWLALWLEQMGARVCGYALAPPSSPSMFVAAGIEQLLYAHQEADIRDRKTLSETLARHRPDIIFHLASQSQVLPSYQEPYETFEINMMGTLCLLESVRALSLPCVVVVITSDKCYENTESFWGYRECDPMGGSDPYSASKGAAEIAVASYRRSFFPPEAIDTHGVLLATARAGNVIGGGDWSTYRLVADLVRCFSTEQEVILRHPKAVRPWQHVLEPLSGYLSLATKMLVSKDPHLCSSWNFGPSPEDMVSVETVVSLFAQAWPNGSWRATEQEHPKETQVLRLNTEKALWRLGWKPRWGLSQAVARSVAWYRAFYQSAPSEQIEMTRQRSREDIASYCKAL